MKKTIARLLSILLVAGCVAGCAAEEKKSHVPTGDGLSWGDETVAAPSAGQQTQENIVMAYYTTLSMNPYTCTDYTNRALFSLLYQSLFVTDREGTVSPLLCQSYVVSEDMKNYTFYLMPNARFADGEAVTGEDVTASLLAAMGSGYYVGRFTHVKNISNTRDGGVLIQLDTAYENLPLLLDIPIVKKEEVAAEMPIGSGPYVMRTSENAASLYRNSSWWCDAELPVNQQVIQLSPIAGTTDGPVEIRDQFEFYDVNLVLADPCSDFYAAYRCDYELWDCDNGIFVYLGCRTDSGLFANKEVRSALTYAIDRELIAEEYYRGFAQPTVLPAPSNSEYYDEVLASRYTYQSDLLTQAVAKAGEKGRQVVLLANSSDTLRVRAARAIADMLTQCGLEVILKEETSEDYYQALRMKDYDLYLGQTRLPPNLDLSEFFYEDGKLSFGPMNDAAIYTLCLKALENSGNYTDLYQMILDDGRLCPILFRSYAVYADRGMLEDLAPARDNLFYYDLGRTLEDARTQEKPADVTLPGGSTHDTTAQEETTAPDMEN